MPVDNPEEQNTDHTNHPDAFNATRFSLTIEEILIQIRSIEQSLVDAGISRVNCSRLASYRSIVEDALVNKKSYKQTIQNALLLNQAIHEIPQLFKIVENLLISKKSNPWLPKITKLVSGHTLPQADKERSEARDLQFELLCAAYCRAMGYSTESKEPDILVHDRDSDFTIAAKRIKSVGKLERHTRKAKDQIEKSGTPGVLAFDLSLLHNRSNQIYQIEEGLVGPLIVQKVADHFVNRNGGHIRALAGPPLIFGLAVCVSCTFFVLSTKRFTSAARWTVTNFCGFKDSRYNQLREFSIRLSKFV